MMTTTNDHNDTADITMMATADYDDNDHDRWPQPMTATTKADDGNHDGNHDDDS